MDERAIPAEVMVPWPLGPIYFHLPGADGMGARSWVNYKFAAARWYTGTLARLIDEVGFDRYVGVEMALDGSLASLNGAYDAAVGGLTRAAEQFLFQDNGRQAFTLDHLLDTKKCLSVLRKLPGQGLNMDVAGIVANTSAATAIGPDKANPTGWLEQLRRLRNMPMHQNSTPRHVAVDVGADTVTSLSVGGPVRWHAEDPVTYLETMEEKLQVLVMPMLDLIDQLAPNGVPSPRPLR